MNSRTLTSITAMTVFAALAISIRLSAQEQQDHPSSTHQPTITTFDAPGAGTAAGQGTFGLGINPPGTIAGIYLDASNVYHGFLRAKGGSITTFNAPGAGTGPFQGTIAFGLNPEGAIAGYYADASNVNHGFLRAEGGTFTSFDAPGAGTGSGQGTFTANVSGLNQEGAIAGYYLDASNVYHGFVRTPDGTFMTFDAPDAGTASGQGTIFGSLNSAGATTGCYIDASNVSHGLLRTPHGTFTTFDAPGAGTGSGQGTFCGNINPAGAITGNYTDASNVNHGFLRQSSAVTDDTDKP